jgi:hypothetical protein
MTGPESVTVMLTVAREIVLNEESSAYEIQRVATMTLSALVATYKGGVGVPPSYERARVMLRTTETPVRELRALATELLATLEAYPWDSDDAWLVEAAMEPVFVFARLDRGSCGSTEMR